MFKPFEVKRRNRITDFESFLNFQRRPANVQAVPCLTTKHWELVWVVPSRTEAIKMNREYFPRVIKNPDGSTTVHFITRPFVSMTITSYNTERPAPEPVAIFISTYDGSDIQAWFEMSGKQDNRAVWEKYPDLVNSVYRVVANRLQTFVWKMTLKGSLRYSLKAMTVKDIYRSAGVCDKYLTDHYGPRGVNENTNPHDYRENLFVVANRVKALAREGDVFNPVTLFKGATPGLSTFIKAFESYPLSMLRLAGEAISPGAIESPAYHIRKMYEQLKELGFIS